MNVLMFSTYFPPQYSGAVKQAISLAKVLRDRGHHVEFVTVRWPGLAEHEVYEGFTVTRLEQGRGQRHREFRLWWNFLRLVVSRRRDFDIVHSHGAYYANSIVGPLGKMVGWRSLVKASLADNDLHGVGVGRAGRVHKACLRAVGACVAISSDLYQEFKNCGLDAAQIHHIPNGVDCTRFWAASDEEKRQSRIQLDLPVDRKVVLTVGVFDQRKNIGWLIENWTAMKHLPGDTLLVAVGPQAREDSDGSFLARLKLIACKSTESIQIREPSDEIETYYRAADAFVLPSSSEGLPNVVLEAMASGLPCVASAVSGTKELVEDGVTGRVFTPGDTETLDSALQGVLSREGSDMGARARWVAEQRFSIEAVADRYERLYLELLGG